MFTDKYNIKHSRKEYDVIDLLGDVGGIQNILSLIVGFIFLSISEYGFIINAFNKFFILSEKDRLNLFL